MSKYNRAILKFSLAIVALIFAWVALHVETRGILGGVLSGSGSSVSSDYDTGGGWNSVSGGGSDGGGWDSGGGSDSGSWDSGGGSDGGSWDGGGGDSGGW